MAIQLTTNYQLISSFNLTYGAIRLYAKYNSQSRENNQTTYQLKEVYYCNQSGGYVGFYNGVGVVDGSTKDYGSGYTRMYYGETVIQEVSRTINHNTDGSSPIKNVAYSWSASFGGSGSSSVDISFPKIDRYPMITNASNFTDEESPTIQYSTTMGFSGASVKACIASADGGTIYVPYRDVNVSNGSYTFNLTTSERNALRNATPDNNTLNIRFYLKTTTTGGTEYFSYLSKQMSITNANPTISDEETETDANVITYYGVSASTIVQNVSKVRCEVTATALKGASVSDVSIIHNGTPYPTTLSSGKYVATIPMVTDNFVINVVDSRGNSSTKTVTKTMVEYSPVDFSAFTIKRINSTSSNIRFDIEAKYYQVSLNETANAPIVKYKKDNENYVTIPSSAYTIDTQNHKITVYYVAEGELVYTSAGQFTLYIEDKLTSDTDGGANAYVTKGVATFEAGEHDFQVNGDLLVADTNRENAVNLLEKINQLQTIIDARKPVELYNNPSGVLGDITLNQKYTDFEYIELYLIEAADESDASFSKYVFAPVKVYVPTSRKDDGALVMCGYTGVNNKWSYIGWQALSVYFNNSSDRKTIKIAYQGNSHIYTGSSNEFNRSTNLKITRIVGYRPDPTI